jgi:hypothetical protein
MEKQEMQQNTVFRNSLQKKLLLAQNKVQWLALVKAVMNISVLYKKGVS